MASTNTSWIFFERPARRSPGLHPRTIRPGSSERMRQPPQSTSPRSSTGPRSSQRRSCSRTAWSAAAEVDAPRAGRRVEQLGERRWQRPALLERAQDVLAGGRMDPLEQRQDLVADQTAGRAGVRRVDPVLDAALAAERLGLLAPERQQRPDDAVLAPGLDPRRVAARRRAGRGSSRPGRSRCGPSRGAGRAPARIAARAARPRQARGAGRGHDLGAERIRAEPCVLVGLGPAQPVVDVQRRDPVAELAQGQRRGRSSRLRPRRGRAPRRRARSARAGGCAPRSAAGRSTGSVAITSSARPPTARAASTTARELVCGERIRRRVPHERHAHRRARCRRGAASA